MSSRKKTNRTISRAVIAERAYAIYLAEGRPEGRAEEHWQLAEHQLRLGHTTTHTAVQPKDSKILRGGV